METLFLIYDEAFEEDIERIIERDMVIARYTRIDDGIGARMAQREERTGYLADRRNRIILVIAEESTIARLVEGLRDLRARKRHGLRAFSVPATRVI